MIDSEDFKLPNWYNQRNKKPKPGPKPKKIPTPKYGIYLIENTLHKKYYIGKSSNLRARISQHKSVLRNGKSIIKEMQSDFKVAYNHFKFSIIDGCRVDQLDQLEKDTILQYIADGKQLYNTVYVVENQPNTTVKIKREYETCINSVIDALDKQLIDPYTLMKQIENLY